MKHQKATNLYLYLALTCFAGILAIFIIDGYFGIYDTFLISAHEYEQKIEPDYWQQPWAKEQGYRLATSWGEPSYFKYRIENRTFSVYEAKVEVSIWKSGVKVKQLQDNYISVAPFNDVVVDWRLRADDWGESELEIGGYREYTIRVSLDGIERRIIVSYHREAPLQPEKGMPPAPVPTK